MYFYNINLTFEDEGLEDGIGWDCNTLMHKKEFTQTEFQEICNVAYDKCYEKYNEVLSYTLIKVLADDYDFEKLPISASYDCEEKY